MTHIENTFREQLSPAQRMEQRLLWPVAGDEVICAHVGVPREREAASRGGGERRGVLQTIEYQLHELV